MFNRRTRISCSTAACLASITNQRSQISSCKFFIPFFHTFQLYLQYQSYQLLGQLYIIDLALRIIRQRNDNERDHLIKMRGSHESTFTYQKHARSSEKKVCHSIFSFNSLIFQFSKHFNLGYAFQISNTTVGSVAWYKEQFEDAMAIMDHVCFSFFIIIQYHMLIIRLENQTSLSP